MYLAWRQIGEGSPMTAIITLVVSFFPALAWWVAAKAALDWVQTQRRWN
jgi:hypothetical protein